jgi:hypothetical protein
MHSSSSALTINFLHLVTVPEYNGKCMILIAFTDYFGSVPALGMMKCLYLMGIEVDYVKV